jgi:hypothetical protein
MARERTQAHEHAEASLLDRRSYLKLAGSAVAATTAASSAGTAGTATVGYGAGGYGQSPYGGGTGSNPAPTIDEFTVSESDRLGDDRMFSVQWAVSDDSGDLDTVEVTVVEGTADVNFSVTDVGGSSASGWELFQFPVGSTVDVTLRVKDADSQVAKKTRTLSL